MTLLDKRELEQDAGRGFLWAEEGEGYKQSQEDAGCVWSI